MEELQEADVLWPETPPSQRSHLPPALAVHDTVTVFSSKSFGDPAASSSSSPRPATSTALLPFGDDDEPTAAEEEFQEADVLWPDHDVVDEDTAARDHQLDDVAELRWLIRRDFGEAAAGSGMEEAAGEREGLTA
uniref:Uncharacterized protein n=1 Tax=Leersia perrieri TaxID=77586 RepID=A0A0D9WIR0_9ORYZ